MKIAFIVLEFPSISQTFVLNQITGLLDRGHDIQIFAPARPNRVEGHDAVHDYGLLGRTTYFPIVPAKRFKRYFRGLRFAVRYFRAHPKSVLGALNVVKYGRLAASLTLLCTVGPFFGKGPFDIILCHFGPSGNIGMRCVQTGALAGKVATVFHGYDLSSHLCANGGNDYTDLFIHGDLFLPISLFWKKALIAKGCPKNKTIVHHMGVDTQGFGWTEEEKCTNATIQILSVARLVDKKGLQFGIEAVSKALQSHPNIQYLIVGDGPQKLALEMMIRDLKMKNQVHLLGWKNHNEVVQLMKSVDIFLAPSITGKDGDMEGIPVVLMEALAMGLPTISTRHSGIPELIIDGETGLLAPECDSTALAEHIDTLITDPKLTLRLRRNGRKHVELQFDIHTLNARLESLFLDL
jgi:colanic acid/amylovoran biosynthesis glycosyltransferase